MEESGSSPVWEEDAASGKRMPSGLSLPEMLAYQAMAVLYQRYWAGLIDKERARDEKSLILGRMRKEIERREWESKLSFRTAEMYKNTEEARIGYRKERSLAAADRLLAAVDGFLSAPALKEAADGSDNG